MKEKLLRQFVLLFFPALIFLKKDQVSSLNEKGVKAVVLGPESSDTEIKSRCGGVKTDISITITHLPGKLNVEADKASREFHDDTEWSLDVQVYRTLVLRWGKPDVDLFASP